MNSQRVRTRSLLPFLITFLSFFFVVESQTPADSATPVCPDGDGKSHVQFSGAQWDLHCNSNFDTTKGTLMQPTLYQVFAVETCM
jgi:hypothetical protein